MPRQNPPTGGWVREADASNCECRNNSRTGQISAKCSECDRGPTCYRVVVLIKCPLVVLSVSTQMDQYLATRILLAALTHGSLLLRHHLLLSRIEYSYWDNA